jgi:hypothetical protein
MASARRVRISEGSPGEYRLKSTGEVVADPDYMAMWTLRSPPPKKDAN